MESLLEKPEKSQPSSKYPSLGMKSVAYFLVILESSRPNAEEFYYKSLTRREGYLLVAGVMSDAELTYLYINSVKYTYALSFQTTVLLLLGGSRKGICLPFPPCQPLCIWEEESSARQSWCDETNVVGICLRWLCAPGLHEAFVIRHSGNLNAWSFLIWDLKQSWMTNSSESISLF